MFFHFCSRRGGRSRAATREIIGSDNIYRANVAVAALAADSARLFRRHAHEVDLSRRISNEANDNILSGLGAVPYFCCAAGATEGQFQGDSMTPNPPLDGIDQKILYRDATSKDTEAIAD